MPNRVLSAIAVPHPVEREPRVGMEWRHTLVRGDRFTLTAAFDG
ncbi:hypothetical protein [Actinokineospora cianjurensis]|nr:hypothetical protein [Actinokineospora cianjurensis]